jgi:DNA-binding response OmpR family regulator
VLRRLLYTFMAMPGHRMTREAIARTLWSVDYDPQRHASSLKSNIRRLRNVLTGTSAAIETCENGYRLCLPSGALFTPPEE